MTSDVATAFVERLKADEAFQTELADAPSREERQAIAKRAGFDLGPDDLPAIRAALGVAELSDEDLERVAGGTGATTVAATIGGTAGAVISAAAMLI